MQLERVVLLAAHTPRSQAYLQAMLAAELLPASVITLGAAPALAESPPGRQWQDILLPDLSEPLRTSCERANIPMHACNSDDANSAEVAAAIRAAGADIVIYSGRGGQLVAAHTLAIGPKFLHMHSGWLPEYRGSTTLYYALLDGQPPGVTALFLDQQIDTGPIIARHHYPRPDADMDVDRVYDAAIRADCLIRVLRTLVSTSYVPPQESQQVTQGRNHYVIHPVLKHLAIMSLPHGTP